MENQNEVLETVTAFIPAQYFAPARIDNKAFKVFLYVESETFELKKLFVPASDFSGSGIEKYSCKKKPQMVQISIGETEEGKRKFLFVVPTNEFEVVTK